MKFIIENAFMIVVALTSGAMLLWPALARRGAGPAVDTLRATRLLNDENALVVDVRAPADYQAGHITGSRNLPLVEMSQRGKDLPADRPLILVSANGMGTGAAVKLLKAAGRERVFTLDGGVAAWRQAGLPLVKK